MSSRTAEDVFADAKRAYGLLQAAPTSSHKRAPYDKLIRKLVAASAVKGPKADDCAYFAATVAQDLHRVSDATADLNRAIVLNLAVAKTFKQSTLADDALLRAAQLRLTRKGDVEGARTLLVRLLREHPTGDQVEAARELLSRAQPDALAEQATHKASKSPVAMTGVRARTVSGVRGSQSRGDASRRVKLSVAQWRKQPSMTLVTLLAEGTVAVATGRAPPRGNAPHRFYVDVSPAELDGVQEVLKGYADERVQDVRVAQFDGRTVRMVFGLAHPMPTTARFDANARSVIISLGLPEETRQETAAPQGGGADASVQLATSAERVAEETEAAADAGPTLAEVKTLAREFSDRAAVSLSAQTGLKVKRVVIDAGHGGDDPGAIGTTGVREKDVTLEVAKRVAARLRKDLAMEVVLTREKDVFIPLEERTAMANAVRADLFISIHCNSNPNHRISGVETYYLNITDDNYAVRLAARENRTGTRSISDLQFILADLAMKSNVDDSVRLSKLVQANVVGELREHYTPVKDLGVKHALFYVLIGAKMPAILVETSFVSNRMEEKRLKDARYQERMADGLVQGVRHFVEERQALAR
jgi:N-acetylmuramoyl-L-alanine amidase